MSLQNTEQQLLHRARLQARLRRRTRRRRRLRRRPETGRRVPGRGERSPKRRRFRRRRLLDGHFRRQETEVGRLENRTSRRRPEND